MLMRLRAVTRVDEEERLLAVAVEAMAKLREYPRGSVERAEALTAARAAMAEHARVVSERILADWLEMPCLRDGGER